MTDTPTPLQNWNGGGHVTALVTVDVIVKIATVVMKTKAEKTDIASNERGMNFRNIGYMCWKQEFKG